MNLIGGPPSIDRSINLSIYPSSFVCLEKLTNRKRRLLITLKEISTVHRGAGKLSIPSVLARVENGLYLVVARSINLRRAKSKYSLRLAAEILMMGNLCIIATSFSEIIFIFNSLATQLLVFYVYFLLEKRSRLSWSLENCFEATAAAEIVIIILCICTYFRLNVFQEARGVS